MGKAIVPAIALCLYVAVHVLVASPWQEQAGSLQWIVLKGKLPKPLPTHSIACTVNNARIALRAAMRSGSRLPFRWPEQAWSFQWTLHSANSSAEGRAFAAMRQYVELPPEGRAFA